MNRGTDPSCSPPLCTGVTAHDLPPFQPLLSLPPQPPRSFHPSRSSRGPLPHRSLFLPPFRFASFSLSLSIARSHVQPPASPSLSIHLSPFRLTHGRRSRARTQGTVRRCRRVDERFVGARGRDQTHRPFPPFPRAVTRPRPHRPSVRPSVHSLVRSSAPRSDQSPAVSYPPVLSSFYPPVSSGEPR